MPEYLGFEDIPDLVCPEVAVRPLTVHPLPVRLLPVHPLPVRLLPVHTLPVRPLPAHLPPGLSPDCR